MVPSMSGWIAWGDKCQALASRAQRGATAPLGTGGSTVASPERFSTAWAKLDPAETAQLLPHYLQR